MRRKRRAARRRPASGGPQFNVKTLGARNTSDPPKILLSISDLLYYEWICHTNICLILSLSLRPIDYCRRRSRSEGFFCGRYFMKRIVLRSLASDIIELIDDRAKNERVDRRAAIIEILRDAAIERAVQHDIELLDSWLEDD